MQRAQAEEVVEHLGLDDHASTGPCRSGRPGRTSWTAAEVAIEVAVGLGHASQSTDDQAVLGRLLGRCPRPPRSRSSVSSGPGRSARCRSRARRRASRRPSTQAAWRSGCLATTGGARPRADGYENRRIRTTAARASRWTGPDSTTTPIIRPANGAGADPRVPWTGDVGTSAEPTGGVWWCFSGPSSRPDRLGRRGSGQALTRADRDVEPVLGRGEGARPPRIECARRLEREVEVQDRASPVAGSPPRSALFAASTR